MIKNNFYEDNLIVSDDDNSKLMYIYKMAIIRLQIEESKSLMEKDNSLTQHNSKFERVLEYNYDPNKDLLNITSSSIDNGAKTKRSILAQTAKDFDPLSLYALITVKSKLILRLLWRLNLNWDSEIPQHMQSKWASMAEEVTGLYEFNFTCRSFYRTRPTKLCVFCDDSRQAYGFVIYGVQDGISQIIFVKTKVAPVKSKSLPTRELLAIFIFFKALHFVIRSYSDAVKTDLYIFVDAQVVLSWLLKDNIKIKNIFSGNRVKYINDIKY